MYRLVELASPLEVTFHRAFDMTENLEAALEDVIASGCRRLLTSGGAADVYAGAETLCRLNEQADGRIAIAVGGGLRLKGAAELARKTGVQQFHGSVRNWEAALGRVMTKPNNVRMMIAALETGLAQAGRMAPFT
jgi:copper homeostasis protein